MISRAEARRRYQVAVADLADIDRLYELGGVRPDHVEHDTCQQTLWRIRAVLTLHHPTLRTDRPAHPIAVDLLDDVEPQVTALVRDMTARLGGRIAQLRDLTDLQTRIVLTLARDNTDLSLDELCDTARILSEVPA